MAEEYFHSVMYNTPFVNFIMVTEEMAYLFLHCTKKKRLYKGYARRVLASMNTGTIWGHELTRKMKTTKILIDINVGCFSMTLF